MSLCKTPGRISLRVSIKEITDHSNQSKSPWCLLEYPVVFQKNTISPGELINTVDGLTTLASTSGGALKTLIVPQPQAVRAPWEFSPEAAGPAERFLLLTQDYSSVLDIDQFEAICTWVLNHDLDESEALELCLEELNCTKGISFPKSEYESWVIPISTYYYPVPEAGL